MVFLVVVLIIFFLARLFIRGGLMGGFPPPSFEGRLEAGEMDYDWTLRSLDGQKLDLAATRGKVIFLNMWATWCPPCRAEMPSIQRLYDRMKDEGVVFILVSDESPERVRRFVEKERLTLPVYTSVGQIPAVLQTPGIPATFIVSPQGKIAFKHMGAARWDDPRCVEFLRGLM